MSTTCPHTCHEGYKTCCVEEEWWPPSHHSSSSSSIHPLYFLRPHSFLLFMPYATRCIHLLQAINILHLGAISWALLVAGSEYDYVEVCGFATSPISEEYICMCFLHSSSSLLVWVVSPLSLSLPLYLSTSFLSSPLIPPHIWLWAMKLVFIRLFGMKCGVV